MTTAIIHRRRAMTLFEVMAAVAIFSLTAVTIFSVFRVAVRSMQRYHRDAVAFQSSRVTLDLLMRDLRAVAYKRPEQVNEHFINKERALRNQMEVDRQRVLQTGADPVFKDPSDPAFKDIWGELNEQGLPIDLTFQCNNAGDSDKLSFVRYYASGREPLPGAGPYRHLGRIEYSLRGGVLYRSEGTVRLPDFDIFGEYLDMPEAQDEIIAENVEVFDLQFGYWHNDYWAVAQDWNSAESFYRNPYKDFDFLRDDPAMETFFLFDNNVDPDGIPGYVDVTLGVREGASAKSGAAGSIRYFSTRIMLPSSIESFRPLGVKEKMYLEEAMVSW
ncbi:hypothetical protein JXA32_12565 [Candidatus Sumerlaeota bacterium]|nr:hypothetical protein [Candidatus Sumerlaeota bacterium]